MNSGIQRFSKKYLYICLIFVAVVSWWGCSSTIHHEEPSAAEFSLTAEPWHEADSLFRCDKRWLGGDGAYSVDLGKERVLWLFGDSFIDPEESGERKNAIVVRNSLALQMGYNPSKASMNFYWGVKDQRPASFFHEQGHFWFWPGGGVRIRDVLLIFLMKMQPGENVLGFESAGFSAVLIDNPDLSPEKWNLKWLDIPRNDLGVVIGSGSVIHIGKYVYAFGTDEDDQDVYLVRWIVSDVVSGDLSNIQWWGGRGIEWVDSDYISGKPEPVFSQGQMEFTVHYEHSLRSFMQIQTLSMTDSRLAYRLAADITGPWSVMTPFYVPAEMTDKDLLVYAGKAHDILSGADLVFTYAVNTTKTKRLLSDKTIYYPVFVKGSGFLR